MPQSAGPSAHIQTCFKVPGNKVHPEKVSGRVAERDFRCLNQDLTKVGPAIKNAAPTTGSAINTFPNRLLECMLKVFKVIGHLPSRIQAHIKEAKEQRIKTLLMNIPHTMDEKQLSLLAKYSDKRVKEAAESRQEALIHEYKTQFELGGLISYYSVADNGNALEGSFDSKNSYKWTLLKHGYGENTNREEQPIYYHRTCGLVTENVEVFRSRYKKPGLQAQAARELLQNLAQDWGFKIDISREDPFF